MNYLHDDADGYTLSGMTADKKAGDGVEKTSKKDHTPPPPPSPPTPSHTTQPPAAPPVKHDTQNVVSKNTENTSSPSHITSQTSSGIVTGAVVSVILFVTFSVMGYFFYKKIHHDPGGTIAIGGVDISDGYEDGEVALHDDVTSPEDGEPVCQQCRGPRNSV